MFSLNIAGTAACLTPGDRGTDGNYVSDFYFMDGPIPDSNILKEIVAQEDFLTLYSDKIIYKFTGLNVNTIFSFGVNERFYKRTPVDALPFIAGKDGSIGWVAIVMPGNRIMFTDSIGLWDDQEAAITVSSYDCVLGQENIFKDFNLVIRDKCTYEVYPNGLFGEGGPFYQTDESFDLADEPNKG